MIQTPLQPPRGPPQLEFLSSVMFRDSVLSEVREVECLFLANYSPEEGLERGTASFASVTAGSPHSGLATQGR